MNPHPQFKSRRRLVTVAVLAVLGTGALLPSTASAADRYWACGIDWWDYTCWSATPGGAATLGQPQTGDDVYLLNSSNFFGLSVDYWNTAYPSAILNSLTIDATGTGSMTLNQNRDTLWAYNQDVGRYGSGTYSLSGGTNRAGYLKVGTFSGANGTYNLSGSGILRSGDAHIGSYGTGTLSQTGGTHNGDTLVIGAYSGSHGTYTMSGASVLDAWTEYVGAQGTGVFSQSSGTNTLKSLLSDPLSGILHVGSSGNGTYNLSGTGSLTALHEYIGEYGGTGTFNQTGGTNVATFDPRWLDVDFFNVIWTGVLHVGYGGGSHGTYNQSGGTNTVHGLQMGVEPGSTGSYNLSAGSLTAVYEFIGIDGSGTFTQSGGTHTVAKAGNTYGPIDGVIIGSGGAYNLLAGSLSTDRVTLYGGAFTQSGGTHTIGSDLEFQSNGNQINGSYNLSGNGSLTAAGETLNNGTFTQSGGSNSVSGTLTLGGANNSSGSYRQSGGSNEANNLILGAGYASTGSYVQSGGTLTVANLFGVGYFGLSQGSYELSGSGSLITQDEIVSGGSGTVTQSGGTHTVTNALRIGLSDWSANNGTYNLSSGGLTAGNEYLNGGTFNQSGGTHQINGYLYVGEWAAHNGTSASFSAYNLGGNGSLNAFTEVVGYYGNGRFTQSGGDNAMIGNLLIGYNNGSTGSYAQSGGTNHVNGNLDLGFENGATGSYVLSGTGAFTASAEHIGYYGTGTFTQSGGTHTANDIVMAVGAGSTGTYTQSGGTLNVGNILDGAGTSTFNLDGGTLNHTGSSIALDTFNIGNAAGANGGFTLGSGKTLTVGNETIGQSGTGAITQIGGTHTVGTALLLGVSASGNGSYHLSGTGSLSAMYEYIGYNGTGVFTQSGGTHTAGDYISLGAGASSSGSYNLNGGNLSTGWEVVGDTGKGVFIQNSGVNSVGILDVGYGSGSSGRYDLNEAGLLTSDSEHIGNAGDGAFRQTGGTHVVNADLVLGNNSGSRGTYTMSGGTLHVGNIVNGAGNSTFNLNGGMLDLVGSSMNVDAFNIGNAAGTNGDFALDNGMTLAVGTETIGQSGSGSFTQKGGKHTVDNTLTVGTYKGAYDLDGGTLEVNGGIINNAGGTFNLGAGTTATVNGAGFVNHGLLKGAGTLAGNLSSDGVVGPGNSPGILNITGDYTQSTTGLFDVEIGGLAAGSEYDVLNIFGTATLDGTLNVSLLDLGSGVFAPKAGDTFDILSAEVLDGTFVTLDFALLTDPNLAWHIDYLRDVFGTTDVVRLSVASAPAVPVPAAAWLLASGLLGLAGITCRKTA